MGATMCFFWEMSPERLPNDGRLGGIRASFVELMKKRWRRTKLKQQQQPGSKQMIRKLQRIRTQSQMEKKRQPTLEEWFLASPGLNNGCCSSGSGSEAHGLKQSSSRVFPSLFTEPEGEGLVSRGSGEGVCLGVEKEKQGKGQRGKGKKKVSFSLPGLAQIIVFDSADEMSVKKVNSTQLGEVIIMLKRDDGV